MTGPGASLAGAGAAVWAVLGAAQSRQPTRTVVIAIPNVFSVHLCIPFARSARHIIRDMSSLSPAHPGEWSVTGSEVAGLPRPVAYVGLRALSAAALRCRHASALMIAPGTSWSPRMNRAQGCPGVLVGSGHRCSARGERRSA